MTKQLIYTDYAEALISLNLIEEATNHLHKEGTIRYTSVVEHPTKYLWAIRIGLNDKYFSKVSEIIDNRKLSNITKDWFNNNDL